MNKAFFFQTQQIPDDRILLNQFQNQKIFFSYFKVDQNYYLFLYAQKSIQLDTIYESVEVIEELDSKQRKIRSLRGFFLYALEIMEKGEDYEILFTNLQPFFWRKVKNIIQQNKKDALLEFLFGKDEDNKLLGEGSNPQGEEMIKTLQNQVDSLQQRVIHLENQTNDLKNTLSVTLEALDATKIIQQGDSSKSEKGAYSGKNDSKAKKEIIQSEQQSNTLSEESKMPLKPLSKNKQYNVPFNEEKGLHAPNFITLGKISEEEKIEIIKLGFQLQAEGKISLKKYYESTNPYSLFQSKRYSMKYEAIRKTNLYKQLKP